MMYWLQYRLFRHMVFVFFKLYPCELPQQGCAHPCTQHLEGLGVCGNLTPTLVIPSSFAKLKLTRKPMAGRGVRSVGQS
jgi:hypothetical protein